MQARSFLRPLAAAALLAAPLCGCGFDKFDGRWVANVPPTGDCCPSRVIMDVDGHEMQGSVEDCNGVATMEGRVDGQGQATLHMHGQQAPVTFSGVNFTTTVPSDRCKRTVVGNRGG